MDTILILLVLIVGSVVYGKYAPYDSTDDKANKERSGLVLYTDHKTGCQYLKGGIFGGTTPRVDSKGKHVCVNSDE